MDQPTSLESFISATKFRAKAYVFFYEELIKSLGKVEAKKIFRRVTYRLGEDKSKSFSKEAGSSARKLGEEFVSDIIGKQAFSQTLISGDENKAIVEMKSCPLVEMWEEMDMDKTMIKELCDCAHQIDFGTIESLGFELNFPRRISCLDGSCILEIKKK